MNRLEEVIKPWIEEHAVNEKITSADGVELNTYYVLNPHSDTAIVMVHGFCEFFGKYHELFYRFFHEGFSVFFLELRGYGKSGNTRSYEDHRVTVGSFSEYVEDLHAFMIKSVSVHAPCLFHVLYSHSMGGAVSALYLEKYTDDFVCAILSSPMMEIDYGKIPDAAVAAAGVYSDTVDNDDQYAPGQHAFTGRYDFENSSALSRERYDYQFRQRLADPDYRTWGGTWSWAKAARRASRKAVRQAGRIQIPVLVFQAENDSLVRPDGQKSFCRRAPHAVLVQVKDTKHEIYASSDPVIERYIEDITVFIRAMVSSAKRKTELCSGGEAPARKS